MLDRVGQSYGATGSDVSAAPEGPATPTPGAPTFDRTAPSTSRRPLAAPRSIWRPLSVCSRVVLRTLAVLLPIGALAVGLFYWRLSSGPIPLTFMVEPIQRVLNEDMPGVQFRIEDAVLQLTSGGAVELQLTSVRITEDTGSLVAFASRASVQLSTSALRKFRIAPSRIDLLRPRVVLFAPDRPSYMLGYGRDLQGRTFTMPSAPPDGVRGAEPAPVRETEVAKTVTIVRGRIDAARRIAEIASEMRKRKGAAAFLETLGLKEASLVMSDDGQQTVLQVPSLELTMRHMSWRSIVSGSGTIAANGTTFKYRFRTDDSERSDRLTMTVEVDDLVPRALAAGQPGLGLLEGMDLPIGGRGEVELSRQGDIISGTFDVTLGSGQLLLPWLGKVPLDLTGGEIKATYAGDTQRLAIEPATLRWRSSHATIKGVVEPAMGQDGVAGWRFEGQGIDGLLTADELGVPPLKITKFTTRGIAFPDVGRAEISEFAVTAGSASVSMSGSIAAAGQTRLARLDGRIGSMSMDALKAMWPQGLAPQTRRWIASHVVTGQLKGGTFSLTNQRSQRERALDAVPPSDRQLALDLEVENLGIEYLKGLPPLEARLARLSIDGTTVTFSLPAAAVRATPTSHLLINDGRLTVSGVDQPRPLARVDGRISGPATAIIDLLGREPLGLLRNTALDGTSFDGKLDARFSAGFPIHEALSIKDVQIIDAKASILEGQARKVMGRYTISGGAIKAEARDNVIDVTGEALLEGVLARVSWRHTLGAPPKDMQPLRLRATLGNSERAQLGIALGDLASGDVHLDLTVRPGDEEDQAVQAVVDLTPAEVSLIEVGWVKPPGQYAELRFDLGKRRDGNVVLQNFRLNGDTIAITGWVAFGPDNKPVEYLFPNFSLNTVSNLNVRGVLRPDRVWEVKATGQRFDAREIFRGFLNIGAQKKHDASAPRSAGIDIDASIDTVSGVPDTSSPNASDPLLRGVRLRMIKRGRDLQEMHFSGRHDNKRTLKATLQATAGAPRVLMVDAEDAGEALKLIGIYRHMVGGEGRLEINLDGSGAAERRGTMNVRKFRVIGDQTVSEVAYAYDEGQPAIQHGTAPRQRMVREQIEFDRLRTAFATGNGQLVLEHMEVNGPVLSASLRGTLDYRRSEVHLGGTYTPLSGLNRALSNVPLFGEVLTGPRGEGIVAMTFAIQGPMGNPQVIPNPLSLMAPGFLREMFQMAPNNPTVAPDRSVPRKAPQPQTIASPPATGPTAPETAKEPAKDPKRPRARAKSVAPEVTDGWAATTDPRAKPPPQRN